MVLNLGFLTMNTNTIHTYLITATYSVLLVADASFAQQQGSYVNNDKGLTMSSSMLGTYLNQRELLIPPSYGYYMDNNVPYAPLEIARISQRSLFGKYAGHEAYAISEKLVVEIESGVLSPRLDRSCDNPEVPRSVVKATGFVNFNSRLRWKWNEETPNIQFY